MGDHLLVLHSAVRGCPGYDRHEVPSMLMEGSSMARDTEHGRAMTAQLTRRHNNLGEAIDAGMFALSAAGITRGIRRQARAACEDYFYNRLGLSPEYVPPRLKSPPPGGELMPEPMYRLLEEIVELVVDGDYEGLHEASRGQLAVEDLRRRVEEDCPEPLVLPPRELYRVDAITPIDEPGDEGWTFFQELWTDNGLSRLRIEGRIEDDGQQLVATLNDIQP